MLQVIIVVLGFFVLAIVSVIGVDIHRKGWRNWVDTIHTWQDLLGGLAGFVGAAGVFALGMSLDDLGEQRRAQESARAIGSALAYEAERMVVPLQALYAGYQDPAAAELDPVVDCNDTVGALKAALVTKTPVFDAGLDRLVEFGDENLSMFVRFYAYYADFIGLLEDVTEETCATEAAEVNEYLRIQLDLGAQYYDIIASRFAVARFEG